MSWVNDAIEAANARGIDPRIVLSTVEAETGGNNITGDNGRALGYGQVWLKWWYPALETVASDMGVSLPGAWPMDEEQEAPYRDIILSNDKLSMNLAAEVVKRIWSSSDGTFEGFTRSYVGPAIPDSDLERRRAIWDKWQNASLPEVGSSSGSTSFNIPFDVPEGATTKVIILAAIAAVGLFVAGLLSD